MWCGLDTASQLNKRTNHGKYKNNGSYELELQIPHSVRAQIQAEGVLRREKARNRKNPLVAMRMEENNDSGGGGLPRPYTHASRDTAQVRRVQCGRLSKREE